MTALTDGYRVLTHEDVAKRYALTPQGEIAAWNYKKAQAKEALVEAAAAYAEACRYPTEPPADELPDDHDCKAALILARQLAERHSQAIAELHDMRLVDHETIRQLHDRIAALEGKAAAVPIHRALLGKHDVRISENSDRINRLDRHTHYGYNSSGVHDSPPPTFDD